MDQQPTWTKLDQSLETEPVVVGHRTIQPVARIKGWQMAADDGSFASALGRIAPEVIRVQEGDQEYTVPITEPQLEIMRGMLMGALAVGGICTLIIFVADRMANR